MTTTTTLKVRDSRLDEFKAVLAKLQKRATKVGVTLPTVAIGPAIERRYNDEITGLQRIWFEYEVTLTSEPVALGGWTLLATLDHTNESGVILRAVPGADLNTKYRTATQVCDYCHTARRRTETFVVRHEDGTEKQVGRNCIADFLGVDPSVALARFGFAVLLGEFINGEENWSEGGYSKHYEDTVFYLSWVAQVIRKDGWLSRKAARESFNGRPSTSEVAANLIANKHDRPEVPSDADRAKAEAGLAWARDLKGREDLSDYLYNLSVLSQNDAIEPKNFGLVASILPTFDRELGREVERRRGAEDGAKSVHFGEVGKREVFTLTVAATKTFESDFGVRTLVRFLDANNNIAVWWTGEIGDTQWKVGESFVVKATVKKHDDYKGTKQTTLSRVAEFVPPAPKVKKPRAKKVVELPATETV